MAVSYNRLYKVLEDKNVTMVELRKAADIAPNTMTRIRKNEEVSLDDFVQYSRSMFEYWTEDDFASSFRKLLVIEQFRSAEMQALYQQYLVAGPVGYVKDLFKNMGIKGAKKKAAQFYAIMFLYYSLYDGASDRKKIKKQFDQAISEFAKNLQV